MSQPCIPIVQVDVCAVIRRAALLPDGQHLTFDVRWMPRAIGKSFPHHKIRFVYREK